MSYMMLALVATLSVLMHSAQSRASETTGPIGTVFTGMSSPPLACTVQTEAQYEGQRWCSGSPSTVATWDGTPIDVTVVLPPAPPSGPDGNFPVIGVFHGWGGTKLKPYEIGSVQRYVKLGYAVFSMTDRGWGASCGTKASRENLPSWAICANGYNHVGDQAYEVRDAQYLLGELADESVINPNEIGVGGASYGGILSAELGALNNRTRLPDGVLVPWVSPNKGIPMHIAAAVPNTFASDLAYAMFPNGSELDYVANSPYFGPLGTARVGVQKATIAIGFYRVAVASGYVAPAGLDPSDDMTDWTNWTTPPGPFENANTVGAVNELTSMHSAYYVDDTNAHPAPMLMSNGFWDDSFPADEAIRMYNRIRTDHPETPVAMFLGDIGHARATDKDEIADHEAETAWVNYYVKGEGPTPQQGVEVYGVTCPGTTPDEGPYHFSSYAAMQQGEIRLVANKAKTIQATGAEDGPQLSQPSGTACTTVEAKTDPAAATYETEPAGEGGYTVAGSATVIAHFTVGGPSDQVAARLFDVSPEGQEQLLERALFRPSLESKGRQLFQLHPNVEHIAAGHRLKIELLPNDYPYSNVNPLTPESAAQHPIQVTRLQVRIPVMDSPGSAGGQVQVQLRRIVPRGYKLARDFRHQAG